MLCSLAKPASLQQLWKGCMGAARCLQVTASALQQAAPQQASDTIEVFVNDEPVQIAKGSTVLQACDAAGVDIPRQVPWCRIPMHASASVLLTLATFLAGFATTTGFQLPVIAVCAWWR
eukprot:GHRR01015265.1.p1 GENE.GHRR01015265.1~~GHRR01015265.1.p1  ORF type:complete len:119 (+),score=14.28 GHRR01015265.1:176-532(+)